MPPPPPDHQPGQGWGNQPMPQPQYGGYHQPLPEHPEGTAVLLVGIVSLVLGLSCGLGFLGSPVAWVMGHRVKKEIDASGQRYSNRSQVVAGWVCGIIGSVVLMIGVLAVAVFLIAILLAR